MLKRGQKFFVWAVLMVLTAGGAWALPAGGIVQVSYNAAFGRVTIEGYSGVAGDAVTVEMLKPGYTWAQADSAPASEMEGMLAYLTQAGADGSGYYSVQWAAQLGAGTYPVRVYSAASEQVSQSELVIPEAGVSVKGIRYFCSNGSDEYEIWGLAAGQIKVRVYLEQPRQVVALAGLKEKESGNTTAVFNGTLTGNIMTIAAEIPMDYENYVLETVVWKDLASIQPVSTKFTLEPTQQTQGAFDFESASVWNTGYWFPYLSSGNSNLFMSPLDSRDTAGANALLGEGCLHLPQDMRLVTVNSVESPMRFRCRIRKTAEQGDLSLTFRTSTYGQGNGGGHTDLTLCTFAEDGSVYAGDAAIGQYLGQQWYEVELKINAARSLWTVQVMDPSGAVTRGWVPYEGSVAINKGLAYTALVFNNSSGFDAGGITAGTVDDFNLYDPGADGANAKSIAENIRTLYQAGEHPHILGTQDSFSEIKSKARTDETMAAYVEDLRIEAITLLSQPASSYELEGGYNILATSRRVLSRVKTLALYYKITGYTRYAQRAYDELAAAAAFQDWNPYHFLDTAELMAAFAIGYDWLYDWMDQSQRQLLQTAILEKGLTPVMDDYENRPRQRTYQWSLPANANNWNLVCNGGAAMAAMAILTDVDGQNAALCEAVLQHSAQNIKYGLQLYAPSGAWVEGPNYWNYATLYLAYYLSSLQASAGSYYDNLDSPGLAQTAYYPMYLEGGGGIFNYHDAGQGGGATPVLYWLADVYHLPEVGGYRRQKAQQYAKTAVAEDILWYRPEKCAAFTQAQKDMYFQKAEVVTMRSGWNEEDLFVGFQTGDNSVSHAQLDMGTFVLDAGGERFFLDLGLDSYDIGSRFNLYRNRAEGHNTLVIGPGSGNDQELDAVCGIGSFAQNDSTAYAVCDMTSAYRNKADSVKRGVMLKDGRKAVILQDEFLLKNRGTVYWFAHTDADIQIAADGKSAVLTKNGKRLLAKLLSQDGVFTQMEAKPLPTSPIVSGQAVNQGVNKLTVALTNSKEADIRVGFTLLDGAAADYDFGAALPLDSWTLD